MTIYPRAAKSRSFGFWVFIGHASRSLILLTSKEIGLIEASIYTMCLLNKCICWLHKIFVDREIFVNYRSKKLTSFILMTKARVGTLGGSGGEGWSRLSLTPPPSFAKIDIVIINDSINHLQWIKGGGVTQPPLPPP